MKKMDDCSLELQYKQAVMVCNAPFKSVSLSTKAEEIRAGKLLRPTCERQEMKPNLSRHERCAHRFLELLKNNGV